MSVAVLIVNYRTADLVVGLLESLEPELRTFPGARAIVVDNASGDGSAEKIGTFIRDRRLTWATLVASEKNGGFAHGNNLAIAEARRSPEPHRYYYLLNPDTVVLPGAVRELVAFLDAHPRAGIAGGAQQLPDGTTLEALFRFHSVLGELELTLGVGPISRRLAEHTIARPIPEQPAQADWVSGATMMIRREVVDQVGLLDDRYFLYYEEMDYCRRAVEAGWECWVVPASRILHFAGQSTGVTTRGKKPGRRPQYWFDSRRRYFLKHHGPITFHAANLSWLYAYPIGKLYRRLRGRPDDDPPRLWWDFVRFNYLVPAFSQRPTDDNVGR